MAKMIVPCLENGSIYNNLTRWTVECGNATGHGREQLHHSEEETEVQHVVSIVVAICFGLMGLVGLFGNSLVVLGE